MECYNKIHIRLKGKNLTPYVERNYLHTGIYVDCGKCLNCLANRALHKAMRMQHEASTKNELGQNIYRKHFITFTYDDENENIKYITTDDKKKYTLRKDLIRKVRDKIYSYFYRRDRDLAKSYKYMIAGEYGENGTERPHYHMILLTSKKHNKVIDKWIKELKGGRTTLDKDVTDKALFYTAGYTAKKFGTMKKDTDIEQPFLIQSRGLAKEWVKQNAKRIIANGYISVYSNSGEIKKGIPRIYLDWMEKYNLVDTEEIDRVIQEKRDWVNEKELKQINEVVGETHFKLTGRIWTRYDKVSIKTNEIYETGGGLTTNQYVNDINEDTGFYNSLYEDYKIKKNRILLQRAVKKLKEYKARKVQKYVKLFAT